MRPDFSRWLLAALLTLLPFAALAEAPAPKIQAPGYYRLMLGQIEITALFDGAIELDTKLLKNTDEDELRRLLSRLFVGNPKMQTAVNGYLINTGSNLVLVDAGAGRLFGPALGQIAANLMAAGYQPNQVDTVVITHLHGDHVGGLLTAERTPAFPKAKVLVAATEADYWLSPKTAESAPPARQPMFKLMRDVAGVFQASGQWRTFKAGDLLVPGLRAVEAGGHTPGHTAFAVESEGKKLFIWGDLVHAHAVQFAKPGVAIEFDVDPEQAVATRRQILAAMAASGSLVAGMHLPFPGIGRVRAEGEGSFAWVPVEFTPIATPGK